YGLTAAEVAHNLPLLDTTRTAVSTVCPRFTSPMQCTPGKYRRIDGLCNNLYSPTWGATRAVFTRFLPPDYIDGVSAPRLALDGSPLPNARLVSSIIHRDDGFHDHAATLFIVAWGQLMDHDFTLTAMPLDPNNRNELLQCCHLPPDLKDPNCFEIDIAPDDPFYRLFRFTCLDFTRAFPGVQQNCKLGPRTAFNILTGVIDGNTVYGGTDQAARDLRTGVGGQLRHFEGFPGLPLKPLLPLKTDIPDEGCIREDPSQRCFLAGEIRVNETGTSVLRVNETGTSVLRVNETGTSVLRVNETGTSVLRVNETDTGVLRVNETDTGVLRVNETGTSVLRVNETDTGVLRVNETDTGVLRVNETGTSVLRVNETDTGVLRVNETGTSVLRVNETDTGVLRVNETDTGVLRVNETGTSVLRVNETDTGVLRVNETGTSVLRVNETDTSVLRVNETGSSVLRVNETDTGVLRVNETDTGEIRVNEQLILTVAHTLLMREHNRLALTLAHLNPHWDDERLYQETRRIVAAQIQHITYHEFLPQLLGEGVMKQFGLLLKKKGYWDGYDPKVNPGISASFSAAAFRFGHSLLPSSVERWSSSHKFVASRRLHDLIRQPYDLFRPGVLDEYIMGMANQPGQAMDDAITQEVTNHLFEEPKERFGFDLVAFNLQRGREFGVPGYGAWRRFCGLDPILSFVDLAQHMSNFTAAMYSKIYKSVADIDLWSAGVSERPLPGSLLGPTFSCVIATQMQKLRWGDRYWYELPNQPSSFTLPQLESLRQTRLARIVCDNTDNIDNIQLYPMVLHDPRLNPRLSCKSGVIPHIDLTPWVERPHPAPLSPHPPPPHQAFVSETLISSPLRTDSAQAYFFSYGNGR
ncbi:hypothetical protein Pcinc_026722, partial [Petrolisthes cinctipes]